jgi:hypothetical protein
MTSLAVAHLFQIMIAYRSSKQSITGQTPNMPSPPSSPALPSPPLPQQQQQQQHLQIRKNKNKKF